VSSRRFQFRRFSSRLIALFLGLLFAALATTYFFVARANQSAAEKNARRNLEVAAAIFEERVRERIEFLASSASIMTADFAIKQFFIRPEPVDTETLSSALMSFTERVHSPVIAVLENNEQRTPLASSDVNMPNDGIAPFQILSRAAERSGKSVESAFAYLNRGQSAQLSALVIVPLYAPYPQVRAWVGLTFPIDGEFAHNLKRATRVEVTFVAAGGPGGPRALATTLPPDAARAIATAAALQRGEAEKAAIVDLPDGGYFTLFQRQPMLAEHAVLIVLQRPLSEELAAARELEQTILYISLAALAAAAVVGFWIARGVSQPVMQLAEHTRHVATGDYARRLALERADELGQLATAFNDMSAGLAERDHVRDLLDKNVSPEVAAQLMRDGAALGGEEREVTVLFADLRAFTTMSEKFKPHDLLTLLNRHLDRMGAEIERQGGVIDKFIGDAIMALFGAPVAQHDAADRALAAALGMRRAMAELNAELVAEGKIPLAIGVGINTARVVAGNIGSHRRLNYSVIGDGVNVASRLQSETRKTEFRADIITSAATLAAARGKNFTARPLGSVQVKGRAEPVEIFAVGPPAA
jgi:adenylate cyclase